MVKNLKKIACCALAVCSLAGTAAFANTQLEGPEAYATGYTSYTINVGKDGAVSSTGQTDKKSVTGKEGNIRHTSTTGAYLVNVRLRKQNTSNVGAWVHNIVANDRRVLPSSSNHIKGDTMLPQFQSKYGTPIDVVVKGSFRSDNSN